MVRLVCEDGWSISAAAAEFKTSPKTCSKWVSRFREASESGLLDRSSACERVANRTDERRIAVIAGLRRLRFTGPEIAEVLDMPPLDGVRDPHADRNGQARPNRLRAR
jgi:transposase